MTAREGGCLCGAVRYRITGALTDLVYCHCRMCQRSAGAPVLAWMTVAATGFAWTRGQPRAHRSSERAERLFCPDCGCQLAFRMPAEPHHLDVTIATLDAPGPVRPARHIWTASRLPWFETTDAAPRDPGERTGR